MPSRRTRHAALPALLGLALCGGAASAAAQPAAGGQQITLKVEAPKEGDTFACRIPVSISHAKSLRLESMNIVAKAFHGNIELASTGIDTAGRPLVRDPDPARVRYSRVPLQFDFAEEDCEKVTGLGVVFASCTFESGDTENCLDRLRFEPESAGQVAFFVGEPASPER